MVMGFCSFNQKISAIMEGSGDDNRYQVTQYKGLIYKIVECINSYKSEEAAQIFCEEFMDLFYEV